MAHKRNPQISWRQGVGSAKLTATEFLEALYHDHTAAQISEKFLSHGLVVSPSAIAQKAYSIGLRKRRLEVNRAEA